MAGVRGKKVKFPKKKGEGRWRLRPVKDRAPQLFLREKKVPLDVKDKNPQGGEGKEGKNRHAEGRGQEPIRKNDLGRKQPPFFDNRMRGGKQKRLLKFRGIPWPGFNCPDRGKTIHRVPNGATTQKKGASTEEKVCDLGNSKSSGRGKGGQNALIIEGEYSSATRGGGILQLEEAPRSQKAQARLFGGCCAIETYQLLVRGGSKEKKPDTRGRLCSPEGLEPVHLRPSLKVRPGDAVTEGQKGTSTTRSKVVSISTPHENPS